MQRTLVFDVDDTICVHTNRDYANAAPIAATIDRINALHGQGYRIVLYTARGQHSCNGDLQMIKERNEATLVNWLERHHVQYDEIRFGKPLGDWYIDDKAMPLETFLNTTFSKLKGGSGSDVYREGDTVIKRAAKAKQEYDWYRRAAGITGIRTPAVKSFVVDTLYLEYIDGTPLADKLSADLIIKATSAAYAFQAEADPAANRLEAYISNLRTHDAGATAEEIIYELERLQSDIQKRISFSHGDMALSNVIDRDGRLYLIDPNYKPEFSSYLLDLAKIRFSLNGYEYVFDYSDMNPEPRYLEMFDKLVEPADRQLVQLFEITHWLRLRKYKTAEQQQLITGKVGSLWRAYQARYGGVHD